MPAWKKVITSGSDASLSSLIVTDGGITGSLLGTASYAVTASYIDPTLIFPYTGSAIITGSLQVIGTLTNGDGTPVASGPFSHAEGESTQAIGYAAHAEGSNTIASGEASHAEGYQTITHGSYSHAEGNLTTAGWRAFAISSVSAGLITISDNIDYSSEFTSGIVILDNIQYGYNAIAFNSPDFTIQLDNIDINGGTYVADINILNSPLATNILGVGAHATGLGTKALGNYSETGGDSTTASGYAAHAEGYGTTATGAGSHAEGNSSKAYGESSHSEGDATLASGYGAHAEGRQTISSGDNSHAEGQQTTAYGQSSHAEGQNSISSGSYSHAEGSGTSTIGNSAHSEGIDTQAIGDYAHSEGYLTRAAGEGSHAEGYGAQSGWRGFTITSISAGLITISDNVDYSSEFTTGQVILDNRLYTYNSPSFNSPDFTIQLDDININAGTYVADTGNLNSHAVAAIPQGNYTHAEGQDTFASGYGSHAEGKASRAYGEYSHAEGTGTTIGDYSHAEGTSTLTIGEGSHAEGQDTFASGYGSHAEGKASIAIGDYSHAEGESTRAGWRAFTVSSVVAGLITISDNIDYSAEFPGSNLILDNIQYYYNAIAFSAPNFTIQLDDITVNGGSYVADSSNLNSSAAVNLLGAYSHTEGGSTRTFGDYSRAEGYKTEARGVTSHAEGDSTIAAGNTSHAEGQTTIASGDNSHAEGQNTAASGKAAHTEGAGTIASGDYSHSEGQATISSGKAAHSEGSNTVAFGDYSHAEGGSTRAGWRAFTISSVVAGLISIDDNIDYSTEFFSGTVILDNQLYTYNSTSFSSPSFTIQLDNVTINSGNYIADLSNLNSVAASNVLGSYSHAEGYGTTAIGDNSHAEGVGTTATNGNSHAEGNYTIASGGSSHAEGASTIAIGDTSHAEGDTTIAIGTGAHSEGSETISGWRAFTVSSVVAGLITISDNIDYTSEFTGYSGNVLLDYKVYSFNTLAFNSPDFTIQLDDVTVNGGSNVAELGNLNSPLASISARDYGHAEGRFSKALGNYSHAEGRETVATNDGAHSEGVGAQAEGVFSHAEGRYSISSGAFSHAEGNYTTASGGASHAEGSLTTATGVASHAEGRGTIAASNFSHVSGLYNITSSVVGAFIVGNGVDDATRSNLLFAGDSTVQITGSLQVTGGITGSVYGMPFLRNKTNPSATDTITINQSIFNPANLTVLSTSIFIIEADADYYVLGDLINSGSIVVDGTLKVGGVLYNAGTITGTGIIE